jgi:hypothetical protein
MEPLSALAVAAAVIQFADFGYRLLRGAHDRYTSPSGLESQAVEVSTVSKDLSQLAEDVESKLGVGTGPSEEAFRCLCRECKEVHDALQRILAELQARDTSRLALAARSLVAAWKEVAGESEIQKLEKRLNNIRQQMMTALLCLLLWVTCNWVMVRARVC